MTNVGELRAELRRIAAAIQVERAMIDTTQESFKDDAARMRYIWRNSSREEQVKSGWIRLSGPVPGTQIFAHKKMPPPSRRRTGAGLSHACQHNGRSESSE